MDVRKSHVLSILVASSLTFTTPCVAQMPFRDAVEAGDLVFLSGEIGLAPPGSDPLADGMDAAAISAMTKIGKTLRAHGLDFDNVVKCTVMLKDMDAWQRFNRVYMTFFKPHLLPARSAFATAGLAYGALVEVECTALRPRKKKG